MNYVLTGLLALLITCRVIAQTATPTLVKDINPLDDGSEPRITDSQNGWMYIKGAVTVINSGYTSFSDSQWRTDGTTISVIDSRTANAAKLGLPNTFTVFDNWLTVNGTTYFKGDNGVQYGIWKTDGTVAGTVYIFGIFSTAQLGPNLRYRDYYNAMKPNFQYINNRLLFTEFAYDQGTNDARIWQSDGTPSGTTVLTTAPYRYNGDLPRSFQTVGNTLYFVQGSRGDQGNLGDELWKTDGTVDGTVMVKDIQTGSGSSSPSDLVNVGRTLFFSANDGVNGQELWKTDGTTAGTVLVKDINPGSAGSFSGDPTVPKLISFNAILLLEADDGTHGTELWRSDGTTAGTQLVLDINPGAQGGYFPGMYGLNPLGNTKPFLFGGKLYFQATDNTHGQELWRTDGTTAGTTLVADLNSGTGSSYVDKLYDAGTQLFIPARLVDDSRTTFTLWKSNGLAVGQVTTGLFPARESPYANVRILNGQAVFCKRDAVSGDIGLYQSDGTAVSLIKTITLDRYIGQGNFGDFIGGPVMLGVFNNRLYFSNTDDHGAELWRTDGTAINTGLFANLNLQGSSAFDYYGGGASRANTLFLDAYDGTTRPPAKPYDLWKTDGTTSGTQRVKSLDAANSFWRYSSLSVFQNKLYFPVEKPGYDYSIWQTDGTDTGTTLFWPQDVNLLTVDNKLYILDRYNKTLYVTTDGYTSTILSTGNTELNKLFTVNGKVYFFRSGSDYVAQLWTTNGTVAGTTLIQTTGSSAYDVNSVIANNVLYFVGNDATHGYELWRTDGTTAGTYMIKDMVPGTGSIQVDQLVAAGNQVYFLQRNGSDLWKTDGTETGTVLVKSFFPYNTQSLGAVGNLVLFSTYNIVNGAYAYTLWKSDGTQDGTVTLKTGVGYGNWNPKFVYNNSAYFIALDIEHGQELWKTDGTEAGTTLVADLYPGAVGSTPNLIDITNNTLYFTAFTPTYGRELWKLPLSDNCVTNTTLKSGSWNDPTVWSCGTVPSTTNDVTISPAHSITINGIAAQAKQVSLSGKIIYQNNGKLQIGQ